MQDLNKVFYTNYVPAVQLRDGGRELVQLPPVLAEPRRVVRHHSLVHALLPSLDRRLSKGNKFRFNLRALVLSIFCNFR